MRDPEPQVELGGGGEPGVEAELRAADRAREEGRRPGRHQLAREEPEHVERRGVEEEHRLPGRVDHLVPTVDGGRAGMRREGGDGGVHRAGREHQGMSGVGHQLRQELC